MIKKVIKSFIQPAPVDIRDFKIGDYGQRTTNEDERELGRGALRMLKTKHNYVVRCVPARYDSFPGFSRSL